MRVCPPGLQPVHLIRSWSRTVYDEPAARYQIPQSFLKLNWELCVTASREKKQGKGNTIYGVRNWVSVLNTRPLHRRNDCRSR